jgi:hypothetical protein
MEVQVTVKENTKLFDNICTQNIRIINDTVKSQYIGFLEKEIIFALKALSFM